MSASGLHDRLRAVVGDQTYRALGDATGQNAETVRRYMQGQSPSVEFLGAVCATQGISADWLLTGEGPMRAAEARRRAQALANPGELLSAVAEALERLGARVDRIEVFVQTLETRVRGEGAPRAEAPAANETGATDERYTEPRPRSSPEAIARARGAADALARRSPADAD